MVILVRVCAEDDAVSGQFLVLQVYFRKFFRWLLHIQVCILRGKEMKQR